MTLGRSEAPASTFLQPTGVGTAGRIGPVTPKVAPGMGLRLGDGEGEGEGLGEGETTTA
jgi:hypothetical protein